MPDGDRIQNLPHKYKQVYKQICEGQYDSYQLAYEIAAPLITDVKDYENGPIRFLQNVLHEINTIESGPLFWASINWQEVKDKTQIIAGNARGDKRGCNIALKASYEFIDQMQQLDAPPDAYDIQLYSKYIEKILQLNFEECIPTSDHHDGADHDTVISSLEEMRPYITEITGYLANQISQTGKVENLRRPNYHAEEIGLNDNLLEP